MNLTDTQVRKLEDLKARQLAGERLPCPRCGRDTMDANPVHNALSRHADVLVCSACGMAEALADVKGAVIPLSQWAFFAPASPKPLTANELVACVMTEHVRFLTTLFERWQEEREYEDFEEYRDAAKSKCPGLTELWESPFRAVYQAADGRVVVRFKISGDNVEITADIVK